MAEIFDHERLFKVFFAFSAVSIIIIFLLFCSKSVSDFSIVEPLSVDQLMYSGSSSES
jgi:hypothetical protein